MDKLIHERTYSKYAHFISLQEHGGLNLLKLMDGHGATSGLIVASITPEQKKQLADANHWNVMHLKFKEKCYLVEGFSGLHMDIVVEDVISIKPWKEFAAEIQADKEPPPPPPNTESIVKKGI